MRGWGGKVSLDHGQKMGIGPYPNAESSSGLNEGLRGQIEGGGGGGGRKEKNNEREWNEMK